ncbi:TlpA disulfide reductase family protein [Parasegetibacter sp. NRK P23]|uniref:TlpA family protein disulfide reductase n=1 Tax=Parasegetibacter sp. NRK P23 TaxID=2942999 RepID=UPI0020441BA2|nr:TlpA disulfide reductase family protein [Parasegetibacter sp. NRK P23]MCM5527761.1 TlpA family protein disulfide reductase [Parasegetibacter sp. NRK P23]
MKLKSGLTITTIAGNKITIPPFSEKYVLIDFWGTWCVSGPCFGLMPKFRMFAEQYKDKVAIVSIAFDDDVKKVKAYADTNKTV